MKMSDVFDDEVVICELVLSNNHKSTYKPEYGNDVSIATREQEQAINSAVNNHDALVYALANITEKLNYNSMGCCDYCGCGVAGDHKKGCDYVSAVSLLDKIKGES